MAMSDHLVLYRSYSDAELVAEMTLLKQQDTIFTQQAQGGTSMTRDLRLLTEKKNAVAFVQAERRGTVTQRAPYDQSFGQTNFENC